MKVTFEPAASDELNRIFEWTAKDNPRAAAEMITRIEAKVLWSTALKIGKIGDGLLKGRSTAAGRCATRSAPRRAGTRSAMCA